MLIPMCVCQRQKAFRLAFLTVFFSVLGAVVGYYLGYFLYDPYVARVIAFFHYQESLQTVRDWLAIEYGMLMIFVGAFTPIPYKVIAVATGLVAAESIMETGSAGMLGIVPFILISIVGRGLRFYLEAIIIYIGGEKMQKTIRTYIDGIGWTCVALIVSFIVYKVLF
ncbi:MAG: DedA family protein [Aeromonadales bacterium]|nr:DedA family protein [Aeromonadales bacterium]